MILRSTGPFDFAGSPTCSQIATDSRLLFDGKGLTANRTYHFAKPEYARAQQDVLKVVFQELQKTNQ
ncbi:MAG TPA: hypothetical protein PLM98_18200, partial [Thiolinea sp.]|nr:hypothetical protein [Thiolinea sp.]